MGINMQDVKLIINGHLTPRLRMNGATPPFPLYFFIAWQMKGYFVFAFTVKWGAGAHYGSRRFRFQLWNRF